MRGLDGVIELPALGLALPMAQAYANVPLPDDAPELTDDATYQLAIAFFSALPPAARRTLRALDALGPEAIAKAAKITGLVIVRHGLDVARDRNADAASQADVLPTEEDVEQEAARLCREAAEAGPACPRTRRGGGGMSWGDGIDFDHNPVPEDKILILLPDTATDADLDSGKIWQICRDAGLANFEVDAERVSDWRDASNYEVNRIKSVATRIG